MLLKFLCKIPQNIYIKRFLLNQAYRCDSIWDKRMNAIDCKLSAVDLVVQFQQILSSDTAISALDYDILMNKSNEFDLKTLTFFYEIIKSFRRTQEARNSYESSSHAIIRHLIDLEVYNDIVDLLNNREKTGLFLDEISVNLILDQLITKQLWENAFFVSANWIIQECVSDSKLSIPLCLISCLHFWRNCLWKYEPIPPVINKEPVEYVWIPYLRPNGFDDHFDLFKDCHKRRLLGKCLTGLIDNLDLIKENNNDDVEIINYLKCNIGLLGLALHEKFDLLISRLEIWIDNGNVKLNKDLIVSISELISSAERTVDSSPVVYETFSDDAVSQILQKYQDLVDQFQSKGLLDENDLIGNALEFLHSKIEHLCNNEIAHVVNKYENFNSKRIAEYEKAKLLLTNKKILKESKEKLLELTNQEELIKYFEEMPEVLYKAWLANRTKEEKRFSCKKSNIENLENLKRKMKPKFVVQHT